MVKNVLIGKGGGCHALGHRSGDPVRRITVYFSSTRRVMVNRRFQCDAAGCQNHKPVNAILSVGIYNDTKSEACMPPVQRKVFRIEEHVRPRSRGFASADAAGS